MYKSKSEYSLIENKDMKINRINGIEIDDFRKFQEQELNLGNNITLISGRNGSMKTTLMGLIAQIFRTESTDIYGKPMVNKFSELFNLSIEKDSRDYLYHIKMNIDENLHLREPVPMYLQPKTSTNKARHRLTPSGRKKGDGYFHLPSVYINLKRLYPLIEADSINVNKISYTQDERKFISTLYQKVLLREEFSSFDSYNAKLGKIDKYPVGPINTYYDIETISSGEDNLSTIANTLISFMRHANDSQLTGILVIDEFEASLHPIAQVNLFNFLLWWSKKYNVQILLSTHSLFLIQYALQQKFDLDKNSIKLNFISSAFQADNKLAILENPPYEIAYSELTLSNTVNRENKIKIKVFLEDEMAITFLKKIIKSRDIIKICDFTFTTDDEVTGTSFVKLLSLCKNFPTLLNNSIVIFDADVTENQLTFRNFDRAMRLPSQNCFPLEKEIIYFILNLDGDNPFFKKFEMDKEYLRNSFVSSNIDINTSNYTNDKNIQPFKKWAKDNKVLFNKFVTYYVNTSSECREKRIEFISLVNKVLEANTLPRLKE